MGYVTVGHENTTDIQLYYEDQGHGQPAVLIHGYPLDGRSWEKQTRALLDVGFRVITYDRRGFGRSSKVGSGYDYDTLAGDLAILLEVLDLRDVILVGFAMGTGELARYVGNHGAERVGKLVFLASLEPFLVETDDNPTGLDRSVFDAFAEAARSDRYAWFTRFYADFYNLDRTLGSRLSQEVVDASWQVAIASAPVAAYAVLAAWTEDFRRDIDAIRSSGTPALIVHPADDRILPIDACGRPFHAAFPEAEYLEIEGAPHGMLWTHAEEVNAAVVAFVRS